MNDDELKRLEERFRHADHVPAPEFSKLLSTVRSLQSQLTLANAALEKYGHHLKSCNPFYSGDEVKCGCGYAAALRAYDIGLRP